MFNCLWGKVQNPCDIPLNWLVDSDPYNGLYIRIPMSLGSRIPLIKQPTRVLITAQIAIKVRHVQSHQLVKWNASRNLKFLIRASYIFAGRDARKKSNYCNQGNTGTPGTPGTPKTNLDPPRWLKLALGRRFNCWTRLLHQIDMEE